MYKLKINFGGWTEKHEAMHSCHECTRQNGCFSFFVSIVYGKWTKKLTNGIYCCVVNTGPKQLTDKSLENCY